MIDLAATIRAALAGVPDAYRVRVEAGVEQALAECPDAIGVFIDDSQRGRVDVIPLRSRDDLLAARELRDEAAGRRF